MKSAGQHIEDIFERRKLETSFKFASNRGQTDRHRDMNAYLQSTPEVEGNHVTFSVSKKHHSEAVKK